MSTLTLAARREPAQRVPLAHVLRALLLMLVACAASSAPAQAATARVTASELCDAWNAPAVSPEVALASGFDISGTKRTRTGESCTAPGASVTISNSTIAEQPVSSGTNAASRMLSAAVRTAVGANDIKVGDEVFRGAVITSLTAVLQGGYVGIRGGVAINWSGGTATKLQFNGRFYDTNRYSLALTSPSDGTLLPNVGGAPITVRGSLVRDASGYRLAATGAVAQLVLGKGEQQLTVTPSSLNLSLADGASGSGLTLAVSGGIALGSTVKLAGGSLDVAFDDAGLARFTGSGALALDLPATQLTAASAIHGNATLAYDRARGTQAASFSGDVRVGDTLIAGAAGSLDAQAATFRGNVTFAGRDLAATGIVDGSLYYGDALSGRTITARSGQTVAAQKGDALLRAASAEVVTKGFTVRGGVQIGAVGGERWLKADGAVDASFDQPGRPATTIKGSATVDWVQGETPAVAFSGAVTQGALTVASASGAVDGTSLSLKGSAAIRIDGSLLEGAVSGAVIYGAADGATIPDRTGTPVAALRGDYAFTAAGGAKFGGQTLAGSVGFGRAGGVLWNTLGGKVDLTFGATHITGSTDIAWVAGSGGSVQFEGSLATPTTTISGKGTINGNVLQFKGAAAYTGSGLAVRGALEATAYLGDPGGATLPNAAGVLVPAQKGDYVLQGASAQITTKNLTLGGDITLGNVAGHAYARGGGAVDLSVGSPVTTIKGAARFAWADDAAGALSFEGSVVRGDVSMAAAGVLDGKKLSAGGMISSRMLSGRAQGVVFYGADLTGETIIDRSGAAVPASRGDLSLTVADGRVVLKQLTASANFTLKQVGGATWVSTNAQLKIGSTWLGFSGEIDSAGVVNLQGAGSVQLGGLRVEFAGTALIRNNALTLDGSVIVSTSLFKVQLRGTILKPDMDTSDFTFIGSANFQFAQFSVFGATVRLTTGEGLATSFSVKSCLLFLCVNGTYKLYFSAQGISRIQLSAPLTSWPLFRGAALIAAPGVPVESTITGLI